MFAYCKSFSRLSLSLHSFNFVISQLIQKHGAVLHEFEIERTISIVGKLRFNWSLDFYYFLLLGICLSSVGRLVLFFFLTCIF